MLLLLKKALPNGAVFTSLRAGGVDDYRYHAQRDVVVLSCTQRCVNNYIVHVILRRHSPHCRFHAQSDVLVLSCTTAIMHEAMRTRLYYSEALFLPHILPRRWEVGGVIMHEAM